MKSFLAFGILILVLSSCKKDSNSPQIISLLQNKWLMVEDSIHYPAFSNGNSVYIGTPNDYYHFFAGDSVHIQFGQANGGLGFNFTASYSLKNNTDIYLNGNPQNHYTIRSLTATALILSNPVSNASVGGLTYYGIRITSFKR
jgi:hypothetical protein